MFFYLQLVKITLSLYLRNIVFLFLQLVKLSLSLYLRNIVFLFLQLVKLSLSLYFQHTLATISLSLLNLHFSQPISTCLIHKIGHLVRFSLALSTVFPTYKWAVHVVHGQCDQMLKKSSPIFSIGCPKSNNTSFYLKVVVFRIVRKATKYLGLFEILLHQNSFIAQSGHTVHGLDLYLGVI